MQKQLKNGNFYLGLAVVMMLVLFISSSMSYQQQSQVSLIEKILVNDPLKGFFSRISFNYAGSEVSIAAKGYVKFVEFFIRKAAHFMTYFILGGSLYLGLLPKLKQKSSVLGLLFAWLAATGYAATDEFHQMLTGGRTPLFQDVMLDSCGALTACLIIIAYRTIRKKR